MSARRRPLIPRPGDVRTIYAWLPAKRYVLETADTAWAGRVMESGWYWLRPVRQVFTVLGDWMAYSRLNESRGSAK